MCTYSPVPNSKQLSLLSKSSLYATSPLRRGLLWISSVLCHIHHFRSFNCKSFLCIYWKYDWGCPYAVMVKAIDCWIVISEFEIQSLLDKYPWERYTTLFAPSSITALIIPIMVILCHNLVRLPPISLLQRGKKQIKCSFQGRWPCTALPYVVIL